MSLVVEVRSVQPGVGLVALYTFNEGSGNIVNDVSGFETPLNLTILDPGNVTWGSGTLSLDSGTLLSSGVAAEKITNAVMESDEVTVAGWVIPGNLTQTGPARIMTISLNTNPRNITLGQGTGSTANPTAYQVRLRTTEPVNVGSVRTDLNTPNGVVTTSLQHVVFTRDINGNTHIYVDGVVVASDTALGDMTNWDSTWQLGVGNELSNNRPWLGTYHNLAVYDRALNASEISQLFSDGPEAQQGVAAMSAPITTVPVVPILDEAYWVAAEGWTPDPQLDEVWYASIWERGADQVLAVKDPLQIGTDVGTQMHFAYKGGTTSVDRLLVEVRQANRGNWRTVYEASDLDTDWQRVVVDLSRYEGQQVYIRFRLATATRVPAGEGGIGVWLSEPHFE